jgi:hypothetical protein
MYVTELYSTIIVQTDDITLHLEYKQENEPCDLLAHSHSIDVWISSFSIRIRLMFGSPLSARAALVGETWEGVFRWFDSVPTTLYRVAKRKS